MADSRFLVAMFLEMTNSKGLVEFKPEAHILIYVKP